MFDNKQITKNLIVNVISFGFTFIIGIWITPYLIDNLGKVAYGVIPLTLIINKFINIATTSLTSSFTRFYAIALQQKKLSQAVEYFNTALFGLLAFLVILSPIAYLLIEQVDSFFSIPTALLKDAKLLFSFTIGSLFLSIIVSIFNTSLYAINRLDILSILKAVRLVVRAIIIIISFTFFDIKVYFIGLANLTSEIIILLISWYYLKKFTPEINVSLTTFRLSKLSAVASLSLWVIIHQAGDVVIGSLDIYFLNRYNSIIISGELGALSEWVTYIGITIGMVSTLVGPLILNAYAKGEDSKIIKLARFSLVILSCFTAIVVGLLSGFAEPLLKLWLGPNNNHLVNLFIIKLFPSIFALSVGGYFLVFRAWNMVKIPALVTLGLGIINVLILILLSNIVSLNPEAVTALCSAFMIAQSFGFAIFYFPKLYPISSLVLAKDAGRPLLIYGIAFMSALATTYFLPVGDNWISFIIAFGGLSCFIIALLIKKILPTEFKSIIASFIPIAILPKVKWLVK